MATAIWEQQSEVCTSYISDWLILRNSHVDWSSGSIVGWSKFCHYRSLECALYPFSSAPERLRDFSDLSNVPNVYADLRDVFSKRRTLPPHRPYDRATDLLPGTCPPRRRLYSLTRSERTVKEKYMASGFPRPSTSPAWVGFFFVGKKDGTSFLTGLNCTTLIIWYAFRRGMN